MKIPCHNISPMSALHKSCRKVAVQNVCRKCSLGKSTSIQRIRPIETHQNSCLNAVSVCLVCLVCLHACMQYTNKRNDTHIQIAHIEREREKERERSNIYLTTSVCHHTSHQPRLESNFFHPFCQRYFVLAYFVARNHTTSSKQHSNHPVQGH